MASRLDASSGWDGIGDGDVIGDGDGLGSGRSAGRPTTNATPPVADVIPLEERADDSGGGARREAGGGGGSAGVALKTDLFAFLSSAVCAHSAERFGDALAVIAEYFRAAQIYKSE